MKMLIKSIKGYSNIPPLQNIIQDDTAVFRNSRGLFNNIRQIKQIHGVNQFIIKQSRWGSSYLLQRLYFSYP
jgi:hypothetical protein